MWKPSGAALRSFKLFSPTGVCAAPKTKAFTGIIQLVSKQRLLVHQHPLKVYTLAIDGQIIAQVGDSYNWYTIETNDETDVEVP